METNISVLQRDLRLARGQESTLELTLEEFTPVVRLAE